MKRILVLLFLVFLLSVGSVIACKCAEPKTVQKEVERSSVVFSGKVLGLARYADPTRNMLVVDFEVDKVWKGPAINEISLLVERAQRCGYKFKRNQEYLVYAFGEEKLMATQCSRTKLLEAAGEDLENLGEGIALEPQKKQDATQTAYFVIVGSALFTLLWVIYRSRKTPEGDHPFLRTPLEDAANKKL